MAEAWYAGVDGCRGGWFVVLLHCRGQAVTALRQRLCPSFAEVVELPERPVLTAVDIPIGLLERATPGGRPCDRAARRLLGARKSSVFPPPARPALAAGTDYRAAVAANGAGISLPAWNILARIRETDACLSPALQARIRESHPELAFLSLADRPLRHPKRCPAGREERLALLGQRLGEHLPALSALRDRYGKDQLAMDDVLDACALALVAERIGRGAGRRLPEEEAPPDSRGLRPEIWY